jgi:hypothetical protein
MTKEDFLKVYNENLPGNFIVWIFRYFSSSTRPVDQWVSKLAIFILVILFLTGFVGTIIDSDFITSLGAILFVVCLVPLCLMLFYGVIANNIRIKKIIKKLDITKVEYDVFASMYIE